MCHYTPFYGKCNKKILIRHQTHKQIVTFLNVPYILQKNAVCCIIRKQAAFYHGFLWISINFLGKLLKF